MSIWLAAKWITLQAFWSLIRIKRRKRNRQDVFWGFFCSSCYSNRGSLSNSTWRVPETEESHANLSRVVDCFTGEIHHSRETGPPEQPQREARRTLVQSRPSAAPQTNTRPSQTQFFIPLCLANRTLRGCASHPRHPKSDILSGCACRNNRSLPASPRGGRGPSLASLVARWVFVDPCSLFDLKKKHAIPR